MVTTNIICLPDSGTKIRQTCTGRSILHGHSKQSGWSGFRPTTFSQIELAHVQFGYTRSRKELLVKPSRLRKNAMLCQFLAILIAIPAAARLAKKNLLGDLFGATGLGK